MHFNCRTIYAGDPLRSYTSEKAVMFKNILEWWLYVTTWHKRTWI